jgi:predicted ATPase
VPLADLADARLLADKIVLSLNLPRSPGTQPLEQVAAFLSQGTDAARASNAGPVLVLDNFEHLVPEGAGIVRELLERVPSLACLVTSRQPLALTGEQEFPVAPLPVPAAGQRYQVASEGGSSSSELVIDYWLLATVPSVQLFVDRAQAVRPEFQLRPGNAAAVAAVCVRLEGLPLALELAAARVGVLTPAQMLSHLEQRFDFLVSRKRDTTPRQRSLRAALDWSYQLLSPELQRFFATLSVFQGGWTLEAAEAVCEEPNALTSLEQLRECSLVQTAEAGGEIRFRLLETLREFGAEQLEAEERTAVAHRHASYYLALAERAEPELWLGDQLAWLDQLERDLDNLRASFSWLEASGRVQDVLRLGGALYGFWMMRGSPAEGLARLRGLLTLPGAEARTSARAKALNSAGVAACDLGENETSLSLHEESLTIGRELGDRWNTAMALTCLGMRLNYLDRQEAARPPFEEALAIWQEIDDSWGIACTLTGLGWGAGDQCDTGEARAVLTECLKVRRERGDQWGVAFILCRLGSLARDAGDYEEARSLLQESMAVAQVVGNRSLICQSLADLGHLAYLEGDLATARDLLEQSLPLAREVSNKPMLASILFHLAEVAGDQGDLDTAGACREEAESLTSTERRHS